MSEFQRYAVYYLPDDKALADFGASWLGWDVVRGCEVAQPVVHGIGKATLTPRKYGFHGTLKPPFRLAEGKEFAGLEASVGALASGTSPVELDGLKLSRIGAFLALTPEGDTSALGRLAFACVRELDDFRRPAGTEELARRRASGLTDRQDAFLVEWGYPYVGEEFRFHLTLTGKLDPAAQTSMAEAVEAHLPPLSRPFTIGSIALTGEGLDGRFREIHRYTLTG